MRAVVSLDDFRRNLSDLVGMVMYGNQTILVQKHNRNSIVVISEREYERLKDPRKRFDSKEDWDKLFALADKVRNKMPSKDQKSLTKVVKEEVGVMRSGRKATA